MDKAREFILWFDQIGIEDVPYVGGKNASLGEMYTNLTAKGVKIPNGFAITAYAYQYLLEKNDMKHKIREILKGLDTTDMDNLATKGHQVRELILSATFPKELEDAIIEAYRNLCLAYGEYTDVAVRSSATAEDLPDASFAGQQETYLNIRGNSYLLEATKKCIASLFTNRAISYREDRGYDHFNISLSVTIQKMVRSDLACSGVMFSIDTESGFKDAVFVTGAYGLGENVVQGAVNPDEYYVFKPTLRQGYNAILSKKLGEKAIKMIYDRNGSKPTKNIQVDPKERKKFVLEEREVLELARWAVIIEDHYSQKKNKFCPMDMEWAKDGKSGELFIVQARPETVQSQKDKSVLETYVLKETGDVLIKGKSVGSKIGSGEVNVIKEAKDIGKFKKGQILVTDMTDPDWEPIMKIASAIVTNRGGRTCHAAIISRELGIPCVVGTNKGTETLANGQIVTVSCAQGEDGFVYEGKLKFVVDKVNISDLKRPNTKVMMNVGNPEQAFALSFIPNDGVGLAREEFIINSYIGIHPKAMINFHNLKDKELKETIEKKTEGYVDKALYYVDKLAEGIATLSAAFYPKKVILRFSDFKTNEYANLIGGTLYEPVEDNPMIGWRGTSRYYDPKFADCFALECRAVKKVREDMGLTNLEVMIPFCRTLEEGKAVLNEMAKNGLIKGENGLKINLMCEIPSNVLLADQFLDLFDGYSIGSNDLTQLTLGVDRDSQLVAHVYDERNPAVKSLIAGVINIANEKGKYIGICGQAPSDYEDFAQFLVEAGIQSISLNPDTVIKTTIKINEKEEELYRNQFN